MRKLCLSTMISVFCYSATAQLPALVRTNNPENAYAQKDNWGYPSNIAKVGSKMFFWMTDAVHGTELWVSNGTEAGTTFVIDLVPGPESPEVLPYFKVNDNGVFFVVINPSSHNQEIWFSDGTAANTKLLFKEDDTYKIGNSLIGNRAAVANQSLFILGLEYHTSSTNSAYGYYPCVFKLDPAKEYTTNAETIYIKGAFNSIGGNGSSIDELCEYNGSIVATGGASQVGTGWTYSLVNLGNDIACPSFSGCSVILTSNQPFSHLRNVNNNYLAFVQPGQNGNEISKIDGLNDFSKEILTFSSNAPVLDKEYTEEGGKAIGNKLFFYKDYSRKELWVTDGTVAGTRQAPFTGTSLFIGDENGSGIFHVQNYNGSGFSNSGIAVSWDGVSAEAIFCDDQNINFPRLERFQQTPNRSFLFSSGNAYIRTAGDGHTYRIFGTTPGNITAMSVGWSGSGRFLHFIGDQIFFRGNNYKSDYGWSLYAFPVNIKIWAGAISSDWFTAGNWDPVGVPTVDDDILIAENLGGIYPVLNASASCKSLYLNYGSITVNSELVLTVTGELSNYGNLTGTGTLVLQNSKAQNFSGTGTTSITRINVQGDDLNISDADKTVRSKVDFSGNGRIILNNHSLTMDYPTYPFGYSGYYGYVATNGTGFLKIKNIGAFPAPFENSVQFPIGTLDHYNPVTITNNRLSGNYGARVQSGFLVGNVTANALDKTWVFYQGTSSENFQLPTTVKLEWGESEDAEGLPGFNHNEVKIGRWVSDQWEYSTQLPANYFQVAPREAGGTGYNYYSTEGTGTAASVFGVFSDPGTTSTYYLDADADGFGDPNSYIDAASQPEGYVNTSTDCDDNDDTIYPGAPEICDGKDNDCDGVIDNSCPRPNIYTVAGTGIAGNSGDGGAATAAEIGFPGGVAVDAAGNVYFTDYLGSIIHKINTSGVISRVAGTGISGFSGDGGPAKEASFYNPAGIAIDNEGNIYIADLANNRIRKVNPQGIVTTVAGTGVAGFSGDGGPATVANLYFPTAVAVDDDGNIYISDRRNRRIRKVGTDGIITTVAGSGLAGFSGDGGNALTAGLDPWGVTVDGGGNIFVCDISNSRIRKISADGIITTVVGTGVNGFGGDGGPAVNASIGYPVGITIDNDGNIYFSDNPNNRIRKIWVSGIISTFAGTGSATYNGDGGPANAAALNAPEGVALDAAGNLYIADYSNHRIRRVGHLPPEYTYFLDADGDGFGDASTSTQTYSQPTGYVDNNTDCDDNDDTIYPGAPELCDGKDNDCDGLTDEGVMRTWYAEADGDGFGDAAISTQACAQPTGFADNSTDCDDNNAAINPNTIWYLDADNDGYYTGEGLTQCTSPGDGFKYSGILGGGDCNDADPAINPGATEICGNGIDDNCDGQIDEGCPNALLLSISDATVNETETSVTLTINATKKSDVPVSVTYKTTNGTARSKGNKNNPADFEAASGTVTIPPGAMSATVTITLLPDDVAEGTEYFTVDLSRPTNAGMAKGSGVVTIVEGSGIKTRYVKKGSQAGSLPLTVKALPNPTASYFTLIMEGGNEQPLRLTVTDLLGRLVETRDVQKGATRIGGHYRTGTYFAELRQGEQRVLIKLTKIN